jgi:putative endonuclease
MFKVIYLYILECCDGSYYTGVTNNIDRRVVQHNIGENKESFTYKRRPVKLVYSEVFWDFQLAFEWETRIKKWSRAKKKALINGDYESLKSLSKKDFSKRASIRPPKRQSGYST